MDPRHIGGGVDPVKGNTVLRNGIETVLWSHSFRGGCVGGPREGLVFPGTGHPRKIRRFFVVRVRGGPEQVQGRWSGVVKALFPAGRIAGVGNVPVDSEFCGETLAEIAILVGAVNVGHAGAPHAGAASRAIGGTVTGTATVGGGRRSDVFLEGGPVQDVPRSTRHHGFFREPRSEMAGFGIQTVDCLELPQVGPKIGYHQVYIVSRKIKVVKVRTEIVVDVFPDPPGFLPHVVVGFFSLVVRLLGLVDR